MNNNAEPNKIQPSSSIKKKVKRNNLISEDGEKNTDGIDKYGTPLEIDTHFQLYGKHAWEVQYGERCAICNTRIDEFGFCSVAVKVNKILLFDILYLILQTNTIIHNKIRAKFLLPLKLTSLRIYL